VFSANMKKKRPPTAPAKPAIKRARDYFPPTRADHPIFSSGYAFGGWYPRRPDTTSEPSGNEGTLARTLEQMASQAEDDGSQEVLKKLRGNLTGVAGLSKIVSGGQTGADRMALDWAIWHDIPHGGWCPKGRKAEDGPIADQYALMETPSATYLQRTEWNVRDSDGTVIFTLSGKLTGGSKRTVAFAEKHNKPWLHLPSCGSYAPAVELSRFISGNKIHVLNVAGTRASKEPEVAAFVKKVLEDTFYPRSQGWLGGPGEG